MQFKIKIITGYRKDQEYSIPASEAHKAYYLFHNRDVSMSFSTGISLEGSMIKAIVPDYHGTMNWNESHIIDGDDWNELKRNGVETKLADILRIAQEVSRKCTSFDLSMKLSDLAISKYPNMLESSNSLSTKKSTYELERSG